MTKAIIFDCFGVLASDGWLPFRDKFFSNDQSLLDKVITLNKNVDAGTLNYNDFMREVAELAGLTEDEARINIENNVPNEELFKYIRNELKPLYKIGMLSNAGGNWLDEIFSPYQVKLFDAVVLSYEIGSIKPDVIAYQTIANRLGVEVSECIFIDDQPKYCEGATQAGMKVIYYTDFDQMRLQLHQLLT